MVLKKMMSVLLASVMVLSLQPAETVNQKEVFLLRQRVVWQRTGLQRKRNMTENLMRMDWSKPGQLPIR